MKTSESVVVLCALLCATASANRRTKQKKAAGWDRAML